MNAIASFIKKIRLAQVLTAFLAGILLLTSTACNSGDVQGARPNNPPVQAGGMNNPHKNGGDGYTGYKASTDPRTQPSAEIGKKQANGAMDLQQLVATGGNSQANGSRIMYRGSEPLATDKYDRDLGGDRSQLTEITPNPKQRQPVIDRSDPDAQILERVGAAFKDASSFVGDSTQQATDKTFTKGNPLQK